MNKWSSKWPTEPGFYWFYGWPYKGEKERECKVELNSILVRKISNGTVTIRSGHFWYESEWGGEGMFIKAELPELPVLYKEE